jgi:hypothetical protein
MHEAVMDALTWKQLLKLLAHIVFLCLLVFIFLKFTKRSRPQSSRAGTQTFAQLIIWRQGRRRKSWLLIIIFVTSIITLILLEHQSAS